MSYAAGMLSDLDIMFNGWDTAVYSGTTYNGIFDAEYAEVLDSESTKPAFIWKTSNAPSIAQGATLTITSTLYAVSAVSYTVVNVQHAPADLGPGATRLILRRT